MWVVVFKCPGDDAVETLIGMLFEHRMHHWRMVHDVITDRHFVEIVGDGALEPGRRGVFMDMERAAGCTIVVSVDNV